MALTAAFTALVVPLAAAAVSPSAAASTPATASASAAARTPYCGILWGSLPKATSPALLWTGNVVGVRSGRHTCFDRVVFDVGRGQGQLGYHVRYVNAVAGASGLPVPVAGGAKIQVTVNAPSTLPLSTTNYSGWRTFRQLRNIGSFEGYTDFGLGVRARLPMRVFTLPGADGGQRLVVDVANSW